MPVRVISIYLFAAPNSVALGTLRVLPADSSGQRTVYAKHAILGLVIQQPSYARRIAVEARRQFRFADLADSYPYWALEKLEADGLVRQVDESGVPISKSETGAQAVYEATVKGVRAFEDWLGSTPDDPVLRDDLQFRISAMRPDDLSRIVELIRDREQVCAAHERTLHVQPGHPKDRSAWISALREVARDAELMFWRGRIDWLHDVRETLEAISVEVDT
jgi:DNA-binding PadR family transcriptional regulator